MQTFFDFFSFQDPNVRFVVIGCILIAASAAITGCFTFLRKRSLVGDAVAHSVLPGICLAYIIGETKNPFVLLIGAFITGWLSLIAIDFITRRSKIKEDAAIGIVLSVFFAIGILILTSIQHTGEGSQTGLDKFLFGKAASLIGEDLYTFGGVAIVLVLVIIAFFKEFTLMAFDPSYAAVLGFPVRFLELLITTLTVLAVVVGIQAVGVVLMASMLITPAAAARYWTANIVKMIFLSALIGAFSGLSGAYVSYAAPAMPTGPWIVMILSLIAFFSFMLAPEKGMVYDWLKRRNNKRKILEENLLKTLYHLGEEDNDLYGYRKEQDISKRRQLEKSDLDLGLKKLQSGKWINRKDNQWQLTEKGLIRAKRVVKLHRLWEMYLTEYMHLAPDHVHEDADIMEHLLTPELEKKIEEELKYPKKDPHQKDIPY